MHKTKTRKKLIEVALPLDAINKASSYEKMPGIGPHPRGLHLWWARRPLAAARAVIFAQMVDDPSSVPELFPTETEQNKERERLFRLIEKLVRWENTTNEEILEQARIEIRKSWRRACEDNDDHPRSAELFEPDRLPAFHDPFAGGGALPLEAQRLGLEAFASDLNPVAVLINKAMIEIPPKFAGKPPVNPQSRKKKSLIEQEWKGARGLADDVRYYGQWMRDEAKRRIGHLYPQVEITEEMVQERPDLKPYRGRKLTVIAWLWARTVRSPNPAFNDVEVPLVSTFMLSTKKGKEAYVEPVIERHEYRFAVKVGAPKDLNAAKAGTKLSRGANFRCVMSGIPISSDYVKAESMAERLNTRLMAIVAEGNRERVYLPPTKQHEEIVLGAKPKWKPDQKMNRDTRDLVSGRGYGFFAWSDLFTSRQLVALTTFSDLLTEAIKEIKNDYIRAWEFNSHLEQPAYVKDVQGHYETGIQPEVIYNDQSLRDGGIGAVAYAEAVVVYLAFALDRCCDFSNSCTRWVPGNQKVMGLFGKQAIAMTWDFPEAALLQDVVGGLVPATTFISECLGKVTHYGYGVVHQHDAMVSDIANGKVVSTDPPYYNNVGYADLSDFFYIWLRQSLRSVFPDLFTTVAVPKAEELVATPYRHGNKEKAELFFLDGMTKAMHCLAENTHPSYPVTIYYAFKQTEKKSDTGLSSTGWETFLAAVIQSGFSITGTWPIRSEQEYRMVGLGTNALASSIVLVCRKRTENAPVTARRDFVAALKNELPAALANLQSGNIAPVDLAQAAIGPGMAVYTRYSNVMDAEGKSMSVREALALINQSLDEVLAAQEGDFDSDSRWALAWFEQHGFNEGEYGIAETLSKAKNTSVEGLVNAGILISKGGMVRLLKPQELPVDWDPETDPRLPAWEVAHHMVRVLETGGEGAAAELVSRLRSKAEVARELCYRLYTLCERKQRAAEALWYNTLVQSWPEISRLARTSVIGQSEMF